MSSVIIKAQKAPVIFLSGKMTGDPKYQVKFFAAECELRRRGYIVINPAALPAQLEHQKAVRICFTCIDVADEVCVLPDYLDSCGSGTELGYANAKGKPIRNYEDILNDPVAEKM